MLDLTAYKPVGHGQGFTIYEVEPGSLYLTVSEQHWAHLPVVYRLWSLDGQEWWFYTADQVEQALLT